MNEAQGILKEAGITDIEVLDVPEDSVFLTSVLPTLIMVGVLIFLFMMMNRPTGANAKAMNFGRNRAKEIFKGPRTLDIDIELFGNQIVKTENLEIPHKNLKERQFVLIPLLEIFPKYAEPISGAFYSDYLQNLPDQGVKFFSKFPL